MKKIFGSLTIVLIMFCCGLYLGACDSKRFEIDFVQTEISLQYGQTYDPFSFIEQTLSEEEKEMVDFGSADTSIVYVNQNKMLVPTGFGPTTIFAYVEGFEVASCIVNVPLPPTQLFAPTNLHYDQNSGKLVWNHSYYQINGQILVAPIYVIELSKDAGQTFVEYEVLNTNELALSEPKAYSYVARIQAKAPNESFVSSAFSSDVEFNLMGKPLGLAFDDQTNTLSWQDQNPDGTKYNVVYTLSGGQEQIIENVSAKSCIIPNFDVGTSTFQVITVPLSSTHFKNQSDVLTVQKLPQVEFSFNNGQVAWSSIPDARAYLVTVYLDGQEQATEMVFGTTSNLPKTSSIVASKNYSVTVQALGTKTNNIFNGPISQQYSFEKLPLAAITYWKTQKAFEVTNSSFATSWIKLTNTSNGSVLNGQSSVQFAVTSALPYSVSSQLIATKPAEQIDGEVATTFSVDDKSGSYSTIQNLSEIAAMYYEDSLGAKVKYDEREPGCTFTLYQNGQKLNIASQNGEFALGEAEQLFESSNNHTFTVLAEKTPTQTAFFVAASESISVQKLFAPTNLTLDDITVQVVDALPTGASSVGYVVNGEDTNVLNATQEEWTIKARFVAQETSIQHENTKMFYSSSAYTTFQIKRLAKVQGLAFDYTSKTLVFDSVLDAQYYTGINALDTVFSDTNTNILLEDVVGKVFVYAHPTSWQTINSATIGYIDSLPSEITIFQIGDIKKLALEKSANNQITATWILPDETYGKDVDFAVFVKHGNGEFNLEAANLTQNSYTFAADRFDEVGEYFIKVQIESTKHDFLATQTGKSVMITRLAAPTKLTRSGNTLNVVGFHSDSMEGVTIVEDIDGVQKTISQDHSSYTMSLQDGQTLKLSINFAGAFVPSADKYNLSSSTSEFTIKKLGSIQDVRFKSYLGYKFDFAWTPFEQDEFGNVPTYVNYEYYTSQNIQSIVTDKLSVSVSSYSGTGFELFVREVASTENWTEVLVDEEQYLSSSTWGSANVYQESEVTNVYATITSSSITFSWKHNHVDAYTPNQNKYMPVFTLLYSNLNTTPVISQAYYIEDPVYQNGEGEFEFTFDLTSPDKLFADAGKYTVAISVDSLTKTLMSVPVTITIHKLPTLDAISIQENTGTFVNSNGTALSTTGMQGISVSGAVSAVYDQKIDLSVITAGQIASVTAKRVAVQGEVQPLVYYLDSAETTFSFMRFEAQNISCDLATNMLSWQSVTAQNATLSYLLEIESSSGMKVQVMSPSNEISLQHSLLASLDVEPGQYTVRVKTLVQPMTITPSDIGYLSSLLGGACTVTKLASPTNLAVSSTDNQNVTLSFDAVANADGYNIYISSTPLGQKTFKLATTQTTVDCGDWFDGTQYLFVEATGQGKISSGLSQYVQVVKLESITSLSVTPQAQLSWGVDAEVQTLPIGGYLLEIKNKDNVVQMTKLLDKTLTSTNLLSHIESDFVQTLAGGKFVVSLIAQGSHNQNNTLLTLSSPAQSLEITKFFAPTISVNDNHVVVSSPLETSLNVQYFVKISKNQQVVYEDYYRQPINLQDPSPSFEIVAYATTVQQVNNMIESNLSTSVQTRLAVPQNVMLSTTQDHAQETVTISWSEVDNAEAYEIYINEAYSFTASQNATSHTFSVQTLQNAGVYNITIRAVADNILFSNFSDAKTAVRLSSMENAFVSQTGVVNLASIAQPTADYGIYLDLRDSTNAFAQETTTLLSAESLEYDGFKDWLKNYAGGAFFVNIRFVGAGVLDQNTITLSSAQTQIKGFKLAVPTIQIAPNKMQIKNTSTLTAQENINQIDISKTLFSVTSNNQPATLDDGTSIVDFEDLIFSYPSLWQAGEYQISAFAKPFEDVVNVLPSNLAQTTVTRLDAPTNLKFVRAQVTEHFVSDNNTLLATDFCSPTVSFEFLGVAHAQGYLLNNGVQDFASSITATSIAIATKSEFEKFVYGGANTINVTALASEGSGYINSAAAEISFNILPVVSSLVTNGEVFEWQATDAAITAFVATVIDPSNDTQTFWQSTSASQRTSKFNELQFEGDMSINMKAIGNVTTDGLSSNVVLDSQYFETNMMFKKLEQIKDLATDKGLLKFKKINFAEEYEVSIFDGDTLVLSVVLEDYAQKLNLAVTDGYFLGYSNQISALPDNQEYQIVVRAISSAQNTLFANPSSTINAKVLANPNTQNPLELVTNQYGELNKKTIKVSSDTKANGLWIVEDGIYSAIGFEEPTSIYQFSPTILSSGTKTLAFAGFGTTANSGLHYLTSSFSSISLTVLQTPQIALNNGTINWTPIEGADAYYVYINDVLYDGKAYYSTALTLDDTFGQVTNKNIKIDVVPVVVANDKLWGPTATYQIMHYITEDDLLLTNKNFVVKLHDPHTFKISDGALVWSDGVTSLDAYTNMQFDVLFESIKQNLTQESVQLLETYIQNLFTLPITTYSTYTGFNDLKLDITLKHQTVTKTIEVDAFKFLTLTQTQKQNLESLQQKITADLANWLKAQGQISQKLYDFENRQVFANEQELCLCKLQKIVQNFAGQNLKTLLANDAKRYPSQNVWFEELENHLTADLPAGEYSITIQQKGNSQDWLNSKTSQTQKIYVPKPATNLQIIEKDFDYYLIWSSVEIENGYQYLRNHNGQNTSNLVYGLFGETQSGSRSLIATTFGEEYLGQGRRSLNLTELIEQGALKEEIQKLYLVVLGNTSASTDEFAILNGMKSEALKITVLPQAQPNLENGVLKITAAIDATNAQAANLGFEIGAPNLAKQIITTTSAWNGDAMTPAETYNLSVRFVGADINETPQTTYVLSGKKFDFLAEKLAPMNVFVNQFGLFEWAGVANAQGFALSVNEQTPAYFRNPALTSYQAQNEGFNNFQFIALGQTCAIKNDGVTYYLSSQINNAGYGIDAVMLTCVENVFVEDGLVKWTPLDQTLAPNNTIAQIGNVVVGYKILLSNGLSIFTTNLSSTQLSKDIFGNWCLDLTSLGEAGEHTLKIEPYVQVQTTTTIKNGTTTHQGGTFAQLLGVESNLAFTKAAAPNNIQIVNGELVWTGDADNFVYELVSLQGTISGQTTQHSLWPQNIAPQVPYTFKVKAQKDGCVMSSFAKFVDVANQNQDVQFAKLQFENPNITKVSEADGNYITFSIGPSSIERAVNLRYKINGAQEYSYLKYGDANYNSIVSITNNEVKIKVTAIQDNIERMDFELQLVPVGYTNYIASNFSTTDHYVTPQPLEGVWFDEKAQEYFFVAQNNVGYVVKDQLVNQSGEVVATYYYQIISSNLAQEDFYKLREIDNEKKSTISFAPVAQGFVHKVAVSVCEVATNGEISLMSPFVESEYQHNANLFGAENNIFDPNSSIFSLSTRSEISAFMAQNAFGSSNNAFTISNNKQFENINLRLQKYSYHTNFAVDIVGINFENIEVVEPETVFTFKQTQNLAEVSNIIGKRFIGALGSVSYQGFEGTYDGANFELSATISSNEENDNLALFRVLEENGTIKNIKLSATIAINGSTLVSALVAQNFGVIENITIQNLSLEHNEILAFNFGSMFVGGVAGQNSGTIKNVVNNAQSMSIVMGVAGVNLYIGGIAGQNLASGQILQSGNNMTITVTSVQEVSAAGIVGHNNGLVQECFNAATITVMPQFDSIAYVGGIVGYNNASGQVLYAYATGAINAQSFAATIYAGGLVGFSKNANIAFGYSAVKEIITQTDITGNPTKYGGTLFGHIDTTTASGFENFYAYAPSFGTESNEALFVPQFVNLANANALSGLVSHMNSRIGNNIFIVLGGNIAFAWQNS